jgi:DNA helicase-2/ATP-dependent DNA helicase PcrA
VGDDDQAIMAFQGASKSNMIDFYRRFKPEDVKVINLIKNYRSHGDILDASKKVAEMISGRLTKNLPIEIEKNISAEGNFSGKKVDIVRANFASQVAEFAWVAEEITKLVQSGVPAEEIAVIAPRHKILQDFSPYLKQQNVPIWYEKRENILEEEVVSWLVKIAKLVLAIREKDEAAMAELFPEVVSFEFWQIPTVEAWRMSWAARDKREFWIEACLESSNEQVRFLGEFLVALAEASQTKSFEEMFDLILGSREFNENLNLKSPIRAFLAGLFYFVQAVGECGFGQSGGNLCFDNFKSYSGSSKMQSCHDLSGIRDFPTGSGSRYLLYGILSDIRNAGKMLGKRAGNF